MPALAVSMVTLLLCGQADSVFGEDECVLNGQTCTIRVVSPWSTSPVAAREKVRHRYLSHLMQLVTHREMNQLAPNDVDQIQRRARAIMSPYDESHEARPRAYGTVYRTTLSATCPSESLQRLEEEWQNRNRQKFWGMTTLLVLIPMILAGLLAGFVQLDRHTLGDRRRLLASLGVLILIIGGVTVQRLWQGL